DAVKKRTQRERRGLALLDGAVADGSHDDSCYEKDALRQAASQLLSERQQRILQMVCEGWSVADISEELATTPERVSDEKYKAVQKLRSYFQSQQDRS